VTIVLQFYPNGEFSQGVDTSASRHERKQRRDRTIERRDADISTQTSEYANITSQIPVECIEAPGTQYTNRRGDIVTVLHSCQEGVTLAWEDENEGQGTYTTTYSIYDMIRRGELTPLVYQSVENCDKRENRKKLVSMTKGMARNIRNAVYLLEQQPGGKDVLSFLTLTLPSLSHEGLQSCCENWDSMVKRFIDWLRVKLERKHIKFQYVYCVEIQSKRLQSRGEYAPHLHIIFRGRNGRKQPWAVTPKEARASWCSCIRSITTEQFDGSAVENLQRVKYSAGRYLSKYMSKGNCTLSEVPETSVTSGLRTQWGGMARVLAKSVRRNTSRLCSNQGLSELVVSLVRWMDELVEYGLVRYWRKGFIPLGGNKADGTERGLHVGSGCLASPTYEGGLAAVLAFVDSKLRHNGCYD